MLIFMIILICVLFVNISVKPAGEFHLDYSSHKQTATINGIFTILIFFSHASQYLTLGGTLDEPYLSFRAYLGQFVVASFLFFSGFGMMESIGKKGLDYVKGIPTKRFFKVWYHFAVALLLFVILNLALHKNYGIANTLLAFTGVKAIGNSNWYMFVTFIMYIIIYVSFMLCRGKKIIGVAVTLVLTVGFAFAEQKLGFADRYFNTILCVPAGMIFSLIKPYFDKLVMKSDIIWAIITGLTFGVYYFFEKNRDDRILYHNLFAVLGMALILLILMKVKVGNTILDFFGNHVFSIFFLQRLPMILLSHFGFNEHKYAFIVVSFVATIVIALIFDYLMDKTDKLIYGRKNIVELRVHK